MAGKRRVESVMVLVLLAASLIILASLRAAAAAPNRFGNVDYGRLAGAQMEPGQWFTAGRDTAGTYFSPLQQINDGNVRQLGFAWDYGTGTTRGLEATPIVVDGIMYTSGTWGKVYALDAKTGRELWTFDPHVNGQVGRYACCDVVNRGVAVFKGKVYVAALDGRLYALDARTGHKLWDVDTIINHALPYVSTGAPQIAGKVVVIGNSGGDFKGVRGYISAYDLESGKFRWRFFTVPGDPSKGFEQPALKMAAKTWDPDTQWDSGGGGNVWDGMAYDPGLNLLYVGTGNAAPYVVGKSIPSRGDNLFLASILALNPDTGRLVWYYQEVPGESWDYDSTQKMILADLIIDGRKRKVIMHAPKDGFFYMLDRATGELLSARKYTYVNWASRVDLKTGKPVLSRNADYVSRPRVLYPSPAGAHNWQPMSYSPQTGLVYIPVVATPMVVFNLAQPGSKVRSIDGEFKMGFLMADKSYDPAALKSLFGKLPPLRDMVPAEGRGEPSRDILRAWDPVKGKIVWQQTVSSSFDWDGGVMSTAGNLVFQGRATGDLAVYAADTGKLLKIVKTGTAIMAAPMTYEVDGKQYIAVMAGYGGAAATFPYNRDVAPYKYENYGRIIAFKLDGTTVPLPPLIKKEPFPKPPRLTADPAAVKRGERLYVKHCSRCHSLGRGVLPDLRRISPEVHKQFADIVLHGALSDMGMGRFDDILNRTDVEDIHAFIVDQAWSAYRAQQSARGHNR